MFYIYREADGVLVSSTAGAVPGDLAKRGLAAVDLDPPAPGSMWNAETRTFDPPPPAREIDAYRFLLRFSMQSRIAIRMSADPVVADFLDLLDKAAACGVLVDLDGAKTVEGLTYLVDAGVITSDEAAEVRA